MHTRIRTIQRMYNMGIDTNPYFLALLVTIIILYKFIFHSDHHKKNHPPSPPSLPIIGHLHLLKPPFHRTFHTLAQKYGPIFSLQLGRQPILVISSPSAIEECFTQNDIVFANRPNTLFTKHFGNNNSFLAWAPYGPHWRNLRRVATLTTLSQKQIQLEGPARRAEIRALVRALTIQEGHEAVQKYVNLTELLGKLTVNLLMRVILGEARETKIKTPDAGFMTVCDFMPVLRWVGYKGIEKEMIRVKKERDEELQSWVDEAKAIRQTGRHAEKKTVIEELLDLQEGDPDYYTDDILKGLVVTLLVAGSDTTGKTLEWAMSNLLNHPHVLEKAKVEIDTVVGDQARMIDDYDLPKLNYVRYVIYETLRLFPPAPLLLPHYSSEDCSIGGYHVSKGTMLSVNVWALHRDPNIWKEPTKFYPERFETEKEGFKYMPFGIGRRACPGINFALQNVTLVLATLIQCFDWKINDSEYVDVIEQVSSITMSKEKPLHVMCHIRSTMNGILSQV